MRARSARAAARGSVRRTHRCVRVRTQHNIYVLLVLGAGHFPMLLHDTAPGLHTCCTDDDDAALMTSSA